MSKHHAPPTADFVPKPPIPPDSLTGGDTECGSWFKNKWAETPPVEEPTPQQPQANREGYSMDSMLTQAETMLADAAQNISGLQAELNVALNENASLKNSLELLTSTHTQLQAEYDALLEATNKEAESPEQATDAETADTQPTPQTSGTGGRKSRK